MFEPRIIPPDEARAILADHVQLETSEQPHRCVGGHVWPCAMYRLAHTAAVLGEQRAAVLALHPKIQNPTHGCCAHPKLCNGHAPQCGGREHGLNRPDYPCPTARALGVSNE